jgi:hypothetical protein
VFPMRYKLNHLDVFLVAISLRWELNVCILFIMKLGLLCEVEN